MAVIIQAISPAYQKRNMSALRDVVAGAAGASFGSCGWLAGWPPEVRREIGKFWERAVHYDIPGTRC